MNFITVGTKCNHYTKIIIRRRRRRRRNEIHYSSAIRDHNKNSGYKNSSSGICIKVMVYYEEWVEDLFMIETLPYLLQPSLVKNCE
jgi:hypothetical protein